MYVTWSWSIEAVYLLRLNFKYSFIISFCLVWHLADGFVLSGSFIFFFLSSVQQFALPVEPKRKGHNDGMMEDEGI